MTARPILKTKIKMPENTKTLNAAEILVQVKLADDDAASGFDQNQDRAYYTGLKLFATKAWPEFQKRKKIDDALKLIVANCQKQLDNAAKGNLDAKAWAKKENAIIVDARAKLNRACFLWAKELTVEAQKFYADLLFKIPAGNNQLVTPTVEPDEPAPEKPARPKDNGETRQEYAVKLKEWNDGPLADWGKAMAAWEKKLQDKQQKALAEAKKAQYERSKNRPKPEQFKEKFKARFEVVPGPKRR
jgi:hypothetical protein